MSFDIDYNIPTIITKRNVDSMENPIGVKLLEKRQVMDNHSCVVLSQIPDENYRITIEGFNEVFNSDELGNNNFYVNYSQGVIYFLPRYNGKTVVVEYYGIGYELISASRVFYKYDKHGGIIETLEEILDNAKEQLELIKTLGDSVKVIEKLEMDLENGKVLHDNLENDIEVGTPLQENLHSDIVEAKKWKDQLHQDVADGKVLQPLLQKTVDDAEDVKVRLDKSIADAQDDIATIEATGNKEILIQSSQWTLNGDIYEKEITHDLYSENLHVTAKNSNTKEAVTIGYKILDKSRILLKSDENINMSVILSASYYHATQTISDDIAEEVVKARKGEVDLKTKIDSIDEQLDNIETYNDGYVNILYFNKLNSNELWNNALLECLKINKKIRIPTGNYKFNIGEFNLNKGNIIEGDGVGLTNLIFENVNSFKYIFKYNLFTGFKNLTISFVDNYSGDCLLLDPGYISKINNGSYHMNESYILENVKIDFRQTSGYGNGLTIRVKNFDDNNLIYDTTVRNQLVYFNPYNFEVRYGNKCINIEGYQKGTSKDNYNSIWLTACSFDKIRSNACIYALYLELLNESNKDLSLFQNIKFNDFEIQTADEGYFESTNTSSIPIYIKGRPSPELRVIIYMNDVFIWDNHNGICGEIENCNLQISGFNANYEKYAENYKHGFKYSNSSLVVNGNETKRFINSDNKETRIELIDGGISLKNDVTGSNGYTARSEIKEQIIENSLYSSTILNNYDKNGSISTQLKTGVNNNIGYLEFLGRQSNGVMKSFLKTGNDLNMSSNNTGTNKGFYSLNGVWFAFERHTVTLASETIWQNITLPLDTTFTNLPFLVSINLEDNIHLGQYDVFIRNARVTSINNVLCAIKHNKGSEITLNINLVICGLA